MWLQSRLRRVKYITLVNLLAGSDIFEFDGRAIDPDGPAAPRIPFPEYLTDGDRSADMARHLVHWLTDATAYAERRAWLGQLKASYGQPGASGRAAQYILDRTAVARRAGRLPARRNRAA
jgi:hypothetical protein